MAFTTGVHIEFGYGGSPKRSEYTVFPSFPVDGRTVYSQTMTSAGQAAITAPEFSRDYGDPMIYVDPADDILIATGKNPDPVNGPRKLVRAGTPRQWYVAPGDTAAWVLAT